VWLCVCVCVFIPELLQEPKAAAPPETHTLWPHSFRGANRVKRTVTSPDAPCGDHVKLEWGIPGFSPSRSDRSALPLPKTAREKHEVASVAGWNDKKFKVLKSQCPSTFP
jgi:hypothetical protein